MRKELLGRVCEKGDFVNNFLMLDHGFENLNDKNDTFPGHHG